MSIAIDRLAYCALLFDGTRVVVAPGHDDGALAAVAALSRLHDPMGRPVFEFVESTHILSDVAVGWQCSIAVLRWALPSEDGFPVTMQVVRGVDR